MSTSTGPAYKLKDGTDLFDIFDHLSLVREKQNLAVTQEFFTLAANSYDHSDGKANFRDFLYNHRNVILDDIKLGNSTHYGLERSLKPEIFFYRNTVRNEVYARLINFSAKAKDEFAKLPFVDKDMEYYDGSDSQLSEISEKEWYDRRSAWDELKLIGNYNPSVLKMNIFDSLVAKYDQTSPKAVKKLWDELDKPSLNGRLTRKFSSLYLSHLQDKENKNHHMNMVMAIISYRYDDDVEGLYGYSKYKKVIPKLRAETEKFIQDHPIEL